ncbi:MAG: DUF4065 domain-containing protein [Clostridiales Family XIII bacterium]|jgi:uncharacterized phage-associated protein|nr:DUF4065 domain-containing protein [Clostridiales Family XIII bacterium]
METAKYSADQIANWFLAYNRQFEASFDGELLSNMKLQKLLYYAQGSFLALEGYPLFRDKIEAWMHGPVVPSVYHRFSSIGSNGIDISENGVEIPDLSDGETEILERDFEVFGRYSAWELRNMTHDETPWKETASGDVIDLSLIKDYFEQHYLEEACS